MIFYLLSLQSLISLDPFQPLRLAAIIRTTWTVSMKQRCSELLPFLLLYSPLYAQGDWSGFLQTQKIAQGWEVAEIVAEDFNRDGIVDIAAAVPDDHAVYVFLNDSSGNETNFVATRYAIDDLLSEQPEPTQLIASDMNRDGKMDILAGEGNLGFISVFPGLGDGTFGVPVRIKAYPDDGYNIELYDLQVADFNNDNLPDIVVNNYIKLSLLLQTDSGIGGTSTFAPLIEFPKYGFADSPLNVADYDKDGFTDVAFANSRDIEYFRGTGSTVPAEIFEYDSLRQGSYGIQGMTTADFDQDGFPDLMIARGGYDDVYELFRGNPVYDRNLGPFIRGTTMPYTASGEPRQLNAADLEGDGVPDLIAGDFTEITTFSNSGDGTFGSPRYYLRQGRPGSIVVADINRDNVPDLLDAPDREEGIDIYLGRRVSGTTWFKGPLYLPYDGEKAVVVPELPLPLYATPCKPIDNTAIGDFNGDGLFDQVVGDPDNDRIVVRFSNIDNSLSDPLFVDVGDSPRSLAVADFNNDEIDDIATSNFYSFDLSVLISLGSGSFAAPITADLGLNPGHLIAADFNGDGNQDLVTGTIDQFTTRVNVYIGLGNGGFAEPVEFSAQYGPHKLASDDFNLDGRPDILVANAADDSVSLFAGKNPGSTPVFDDPISRDLSTGNIDDVAVGDFNGDGKPDLALIDPVRELMVILLRDANAGLNELQFEPEIQLDWPTSVSTLEADDLNGDGWDDLVLVDTDNYCLVLFNLGAPLLVPELWTID